MEKRLILAMVLSILVLFAYQALFIKPAKTTQPLPPEMKETPLIEPKKEATTEVTPSPQPVSPLPGTLVAETEQEILVTTPLYSAKWSNRGAVLTSWRLTRYLETANEGLELVSALGQELKVFPFSLKLEDKAAEEAINHGLYQVSSPSLSLASGEEGELKFDYSDGKSVFVSKRFIFRGGSYDLKAAITVIKDGVPANFLIVWGPGIGRHLSAPARQPTAGGGVAFYLPPKVIRVAERKLKEERLEIGSLSWAAYEDNYTAALFVFPPLKGRAVFFKDLRPASETAEPQPTYFLGVSSPEIIMIGPKEIDQLKAFGHEAKKLINFGFFGAIVEVLLVSLKAFYRFVPNWGMAIIFLTLIIKILFFPLTYSSTKSMAKMQELQPKIKALQAKYKKAKRDIEERRKMNEEMMKLYKEHGINPAAGCLPILIQFPVFIAFYRLLVIAIELRRSPFIFWIKDLSSRDPYYILPILMGITQYISQRMVPTSADPTQRRLTLIMPLFMTIIFLNFQSGLVLYWLTNNVLQIAQQYVMNRMMRHKKGQVHDKRSKK
jgi:YidC/Oxa1 family membrane protein insertase